MEDENMVNDMQEQIVDAQDETEIVQSEVEQEESESASDETETQDGAADHQQSREENSAIAKMRKEYDFKMRQLEAQIEAERASKKQAIDEVVQTAYKGQINPYNDKPIATQEDYEEYQEMYREDLLSQLGLPKDYIENLIANNSAVKQANQILETQKLQFGKSAFDRQLAAISKINPEIQTLEDLMNMPEAEEFNHYVIDKKYDPLDAYKLVHQEAKKKLNTAEQKEHLIKTGGNAGSDTNVEIPSSELSFYKEMFPGETQAQLRARYNRVLKRQG